MKDVIVFEASGINADAFIYQDRIVIRRKFHRSGTASDLTIPLNVIRSIQFKEAGWLNGNGFIQFAYSGASGGLKGSAKEVAGDENAILFGISQNRSFASVKDFVEKRRELKAG